VSGAVASVTFYDVAADAQTPLIAGLAEAGWRKGRKVLILAADEAAGRALDEALWTWRDETFLPHELVLPGRTPVDEQARVVIVTAEEDPIGADVLLQAAPAATGFAARFAAVVDIIDRRSEAALEASRARFKVWRDLGLKPTVKRR
jgi:DNA polymerase-3 subunit chi